MTSSWTATMAASALRFPRLREPFAGAICGRPAAISGDQLRCETAAQRHIAIARRGTTGMAAFNGKEKVYGSIP